MFCASKRTCTRAAAAGAEAALDRQVREGQRHAAHAVDAEREGALLEGRGRLRRIALEPGIDVEPAIARRVVDVDVVEVAGEEDVLIAPVEERARLELPGAGELPVARERGRHTAVGQPALAAAERQLVARRAGETPRARVVAALPERRLALVLFDRPVGADRVEVEREEAGQAVAQAAIQLDLEGVRLRLAERQVRVGQIRQPRRTDAADADAEWSPRRTSGSTPAADTAPGRWSAARRSC